MELFGDVLLDSNISLNFDLLEKLLKRPVIKPRYRISVLNPDETIDYIIPESDIPPGGINYTEQYQNGQRRNITLELINIEIWLLISVYKEAFNKFLSLGMVRFSINIRISKADKSSIFADDNPKLRLSIFTVSISFTFSKSSLSIL